MMNFIILIKFSFLIKHTHSIPFDFYLANFLISNNKLNYLNLPLFLFDEMCVN